MKRKITLEVINSPTILQRVIQVVKRRRVNIQHFVADELDAESGVIRIVVEADDETVRLLTSQLEKQIDVILVTNSILDHSLQRE